MDNAPISSDIGRRAGIPWYYPVVFLLNILLILAADVLLFYRLPVPLTEAILAEKLPAYQSASIHTSAQSGNIDWYLVETETEEYHLVPVRKHSFFASRCKILTKQILVIPADTAEMEIMTRAGITGSTVYAGTEVEPREDQPVGEHMQLRSKYHNTYNNRAGQYTASGYFLLAVLLSILESVLWHRIKGN